MALVGTENLKDNAGEDKIGGSSRAEVEPEGKMTSSEDEDDQNLAHFLESEVPFLLSDSERDEHHEDLVACSLLLYAVGVVASYKKIAGVCLEKAYIQRDEEDMNALGIARPEFKEYYIQMQAAKRSQAPLPSQVNDDQKLLDKTVSDQVSMWKISLGLSDKVVADHACSGETCSFYQIGDAFVCEKTVCDDTCREVVFDPANGHLVCTISGHCFDRLLSPAEMELDAEQQQGGVTDEAEPFMGSGRFARAYLLGYNCADERELEAALRFC
ncbi:LOW QUALITY PROTEIN: hypothetical protein RJ641_034233 [Dillenia turbinata]|uniref:Uncharacterized protein n=1 Tax=Dillenia turbinata TaxID=194707 RepID=A0AAN8VU51_9MAGN